jgi:hypothetical protein
MTPHLIPSLLYNLFVRSQGLQDRKVLGPLWKSRLRQRSGMFPGSCVHANSRSEGSSPISDIRTQSSLVDIQDSISRWWSSYIRRT